MERDDDRRGTPNEITAQRRAASTPASARRRRLAGGRKVRAVVRLSEDEYRAVLLRASAARMTVPTYLASCGLKPEGVPLADARYALIGLDGTRRVLAGVANNLNQLTAKVHATGELDGALRTVLAQVVATVVEVEAAASTVRSTVGSEP